MHCSPMLDDLYSLSGAIISLNKKTQPAKQMAGLYNKHVDFRDFAAPHIDSFYAQTRPTGSDNASKLSLCSQNRENLPTVCL